MPNVTMFSDNITMNEVDGERSWQRYRGPDLMLHQIAQLEFFYTHGYITKYSVDHAVALSHPHGLYAFSHLNLDRAKVHTIQVPRDLCPEILKGRLGFNSIGVISTSPMSVEAAAKLIQHDVDALMSGDALRKNTATKERLGLIPRGIQEADAAFQRVSDEVPTTSPTVDANPDTEDPVLNEILARHAHAAYFEQLNYLLVSALEDNLPRSVVTKLTAALAVLRDLAPAAT